MALLQMINSVRGLLREERIGSISSGDLLTTEIIALINSAGTEILEGFEWPFDVRTDGMFFYPRLDGTTTATAGLTDSTAKMYDATSDPIAGTSVAVGAGEVFEDVNQFGYRFSGDRRSWLVPTNTSINLDGNTAYAISSIHYLANVANMIFTLSQPLSATGILVAASTPWNIYSNEHIIPTTVRRIMSARSASGAIPIESVQMDDDFESLIPHRQVSPTDTTEAIFVGGTISTTARTETGVSWATALGTVASSTGLCAMIWPVPLTDIRIQYTYRVQHSDLADATDAWVSVPNDIIHLIEWRALQMAYESGIGNDVQRAQIATAQIEKRTVRALTRYDVRV